MYLGVGCDWKFSIEGRAQAMRVGSCSRGKARAEVEFKGERAGTCREGSEGDGAFHRRQKRRSAKRESDARKRVSGPR